MPGLAAYRRSHPRMEPGQSSSMVMTSIGFLSVEPEFLPALASWVSSSDSSASCASTTGFQDPSPSTRMDRVLSRFPDAKLPLTRIRNPSTISDCGLQSDLQNGHFQLSALLTAGLTRDE